MTAHKKQRQSGANGRDPTANVINLLDDAIQRQDDLREAESRHVREVASIRVEYAQELREAETQRIDAIRAVDVGAVQRAAEVAATQASTLAATVATSAETLRTQVAAAATASQVSLAAALVPIQEAIADLRRAQYEGVGQKTQVVEAHAEGTQRNQNMSTWIAVAAAGSAVFLGVIGLMITVLLK